MGNPMPESLVFYAKTRGKRYEIQVVSYQAGTAGRAYTMRTYTGGHPQSTALGYTREQIVQRVRSEIYNAAMIDGINYHVGYDLLGIQERK